MRTSWKRSRGAPSGPASGSANGRAVPFGVEVIGRVNELDQPRRPLATCRCLEWMRPVLDFASEDAREAGSVGGAREAVARTIGANDLPAGQARRRGARLVTANGAEIGRVADLQWEDWNPTADLSHLSFSSGTAIAAAASTRAEDRPL